MSCHTKEKLENMLEDVVNELDLSGGMIKEHGPLGTAPAELVRIVLKRKNKEIQMLKQGFVPPAPPANVAAEALQQMRKICDSIVSVGNKLYAKNGIYDLLRKVMAEVETAPTSPPPSRAAREEKTVFVIICTDSSGSELSDSVVAVAGTEHHAIAYIDLQPEHFQKTYDIEEYTVIQ